MTIFEALTLGIVQGLGEFLPISSSGHLLLLEKLGVSEESLFFNVILHTGTLFAALIAMAKSYFPLLRHPFQKKTGYILLASIPTVALALLFKLLLPSLLDGVMLGFGFILTACLIYLSERVFKSKAKPLSCGSSLLAGVFQGIAVLPGVSRSGATISAMRMAGVDKSEAAEFSFVLSIPIILGSALFEGGELFLTKTPVAIDPVPLVVGAVAAFVTGLVSIKFFLKYLKNHSLLPFAAYTLILGIIVTATRI